jgi:O-antigen/teichoic acid export membrane protein
MSTTSAPTATRTAPTDLTGQDSIVRNVLASWAGHAIFIVAGFILPRVVDRSIGQSALGAWDFAWSIVGYFGLAQLGIGSSVNRYVAKHRAEHDTLGLNVTVSSVMAVQLVAGLVVLAATVAARLWMSSLLRGDSQDLIREVQFVVVCLGTGLAVQMAMDSFNGVLTGCHRWDLHNAVTAGFYAATVITMLIGLGMGGGLRLMAAAHLAGTLATEGTRFVLARRVCPELRIRLGFVQLARVKMMLTFGGKIVVASLARRLVYQTAAVLIASYGGVAMLALYSRPLVLVQHLGVFVQKLAFVLTPTASSMDAAGRRDHVNDLFQAATRYSAAIALPPVIMLGILGGPVLRLWMGTNYDQPLLLAVLAVGHLLAIAHSPSFNLLAALDRHGRAALLSLAGGVVTVGVVWVSVAVLGWGLIGVAALVSLSASVVDGLLIPVSACRAVGAGVARHYVLTWRRAVACAVPFTLCLCAARLLFDPLTALLTGGMVGGLVLAVTYWFWIIPARLRSVVEVWVDRAFRQAPVAVGTGAGPQGGA